MDESKSSELKTLDDANVGVKEECYITQEENDLLYQNLVNLSKIIKLPSPEEKKKQKESYETLDAKLREILITEYLQKYIVAKNLAKDLPSSEEIKEATNFFAEHVDVTRKRVIAACTIQCLWRLRKKQSIEDARYEKFCIENSIPKQDQLTFFPRLKLFPPRRC